MTIRSKKARLLARGRDCTLRLVGYCNYNNETTVACHIGKNRGMGHKCGDNMIVYACSGCHDVLDSRVKHDYSPGELAIEKLRALEESQRIMHDNEVMVIV